MVWLDYDIWCIIHLNELYADVAQLAEQLICNQQVIGSSPIIGFHQLSWKDGYGPLAQLVRAPPCHGGGREFESLLGRYSLAVMN